MSKVIDMGGKTIGRWTFLSKTSAPIHTKEKGQFWVCQCKCGHMQTFPAARIRAGRSQDSCNACNGYVARRDVDGNMSGAYRTWKAMRSRCMVKSDLNYHNYGGAGIKICKAWESDFLNFFKDMGERPSGYTLDRIDPFGDYSPENCRWANKRDQANNKKMKTLTDEQIVCIREVYKLGVTQAQLETLTGFSRSHISNVTTGKR